LLFMFACYNRLLNGSRTFIAICSPLPSFEKPTWLVQKSPLLWTCDILDKFCSQLWLNVITL
uniref:Uncharacterized protein n=1 Tax=Rhinolophus ferrumequinum TaxID=59479 RepID=A0A671FIX1_RHIFE